MLAYSLLRLQWHPDGYLLGAGNGALGYQFLIDVAHRLVPMMSRLLQRLDYLELPNNDSENIGDSLKAALKVLKKHHRSPTRSLSGTLYRLDCELDRILAGGCHECTILIGVLMISNEEFNELKYHSLRRLPATAQTIADAIISVGEITTVEILSALGITQMFMVDLDRIWPEHQRKPQRIAVSYPTIFIAATKACLRSVMLMNCFDAGSLIEAVESMDEVIYVQ